MIWIGTSGWVYGHWVDCFYPRGMRQHEWLAFYARHFPTVEINRSFYRLPTHDNFRAWAGQVDFVPGFVFAVKASRYLTHIKRLKEPDEAITKLVGAASGLGPHLGPFLYQLPPHWKADPHRLAHFISRLPPGQRAAFEFRDDSWFAPEILRMLDEAGCALARAIGGHYTPIEVPDVGPFRYLRVHGGLYGIGLTDGELQFWAERIAQYASEGHDVYVYFNNDPECWAIRNAFRLRDMLGHAGPV